MKTLLVGGFVEWDWPYQLPTQRYIDWIIALKASAMIDIVVRLFPSLTHLGSHANCFSPGNVLDITDHSWGIYELVR